MRGLQVLGTMVCGSIWTYKFPRSDMSGTCPDAHLVFLSCTVKTICETQITLYIRFSCAKLTPKGLEHLRSSVYLLAATLPSGAFLLASEEARF